MAQAGSKYEKKTGGRKSRWTVPLKSETAARVKLYYFYDAPVICFDFLNVSYIGVSLLSC